MLEDKQATIIARKQNQPNLYFNEMGEMKQVTGCCVKKIKKQTSCEKIGIYDF